MASPDMIVSTLNFLRGLKDQEVGFVVIGGIAANVQNEVDVNFNTSRMNRIRENVRIRAP